MTNYSGWWIQILTLNEVQTLKKKKKIKTQPKQNQPANHPPLPPNKQIPRYPSCSLYGVWTSLWACLLMWTSCSDNRSLWQKCFEG